LIANWRDIFNIQCKAFDKKKFFPNHNVCFYFKIMSKFPYRSHDNRYLVPCSRIAPKSILTRLTYFVMLFLHFNSKFASSWIILIDSHRFDHGFKERQSKCKVNLSLSFLSILREGLGTIVHLLCSLDRPYSCFYLFL
jgi:hypothetical protein